MIRYIRLPVKNKDDYLDIIPVNEFNDSHINISITKMGVEVIKLEGYHIDSIRSVYLNGKFGKINVSFEFTLIDQKPSFGIYTSLNYNHYKDYIIGDLTSELVIEYESKILEREDKIKNILNG